MAGSAGSGTRSYVNTTSLAGIRNASKTPAKSPDAGRYAAMEAAVKRAAGTKTKTPTTKAPTTTRRRTTPTKPPANGAPDPRRSPQRYAAANPLVGDVLTQSAIANLELDNAGAKALRQYQEDAARRNLQSNLATIDRNALESYKAIADDYAGRGLLRSGGFFRTSDMAAADIQDSRVNAQNEVMDLQNRNMLENLLGDLSTGQGGLELLQQFLAKRTAEQARQMGAQ